MAKHSYDSRSHRSHNSSGSHSTLGSVRSRKKRRRDQERITLIVVIVVGVLLIAGLIFGIVTLVKRLNDKKPNSENQTTTASIEQTSTVQTETSTEETTISEEKFIVDAIAHADRTAAMYDYDGAISELKAIEGYESNDSIASKIAQYEQAKTKLVKWADNTQITHIFFHSIIIDNELAFNSEDGNNYNQVMTTKSEFDKVIQKMYDDGYVMVRLHDIAEMQTMEDGTTKMVMKAIYLPEGKKPFVLSEDDVSYYDYMSGDGFATKLVIAEDGSVDTQYINRDGSVVVGAYDLVPMIDEFVEQHPDFSYRGSKGIVAVTGYEGIFGYDTSEYSFSGNVAESKYAPNPNIEADRQSAMQIAQALKNTGWEIASHSWGHPDLAACSWDRFVWDCDKWNEEVAPLIGGTDIMIYPKGADVGSWRGYFTTAEDGTKVANERYQYMKNLGFDYFCNVDSSATWVQITGDYFRMGRRNIDGQRLYEAIVATDRLSDLFHAKDIIDPERPLPVPGVTPTEASEENN